ncbi:FkbM family methyltransferase [Geobacter sulfurreducens]|uniref:SAM-dependent methyltransferase, FkbM family n=1 Tax=Geobacter sulfurreducens (strain ATCC 51573 / DSM 12127 / PCA) TaxID=243231 RepID=Q74D13_GEOSL|nr:FkbM family methyltransferase [Geobacter sulfurreducens]AAR34880.1 SAM-dependent methyltransferase, FkbM family [Geobacter sulfurreducens PCA]ADI84344.2 SAM-dependent methyltransferase, FkbM family [Geobacter sulfurreducens KN400]UAC05517.1 FkbM family methyltransferase [Geobacter sulfurreducens]HBB68998.1 FkbM family methyltransferase [Geobacter sulfurreducens]HCD96278.1 FkbM family methyltransferase [Geobacter sulfurreducens]
MTGIVTANWWTSLIYRVFVRTACLRAGRGLLPNIWEWLWRLSCNIIEGPVDITIHNRPAIVNFGYTYPIYMRCYPELNAPLVELTYQCWRSRGTAICIVDVGAAVGDTMLLLHSNLPEAVGSFVCIEGDQEFYRYLQHNLGHMTEGRLINVVVADQETEVSDLVRIHTGTASAQGERTRGASTLSAVVTEEIDLIKIDVDGFDGRVLLGAEDLLKRCRPLVIFEWHPSLCRQTGNNWTDHFDVLARCGYSRCLWFTKFGHFSHFSFGHCREEIDTLAEYCMSDVVKDWHYDVIALHDDSDLSLLLLSQLGFAKARPSRY